MGITLKMTTTPYVPDAAKLTAAKDVCKDAKLAGDALTKFTKDTTKCGTDYAAKAATLKEEDFNAFVKCYKDACTAATPASNTMLIVIIVVVVLALAAGAYFMMNKKKDGE